MFLLFLSTHFFNCFKLLETKDFEKAYHRPNFEARLGNIFRVSDKIVSNLDFYFLSSTYGTDPFIFEDVKIPVSALIGTAGEGFKLSMSVLDVFRSTVGAAALGFARRALDETINRVQNRELFGAPLFDLQMVQGHVAEMALDVDAAALLVYRAAWTKDMGAARVTREAAMAKLYATDKAQEVIDKAVQIHGGDGVRKGSVVEGLYREIRALRIYEGASDVQKVVIARQALTAG